MIRSKRTNFQILTKLFKGIAFSVAAIDISFFRKPASGWQPAWHIPTKPFCDGEQGRQDSNGPIPGRPVRAAVWESGGDWGLRGASADRWIQSRKGGCSQRESFGEVDWNQPEKFWDVNMGWCWSPPRTSHRNTLNLQSLVYWEMLSPSFLSSKQFSMYNMIATTANFPANPG